MSDIVSTYQYYFQPDTPVGQHLLAEFEGEEYARLLGFISDIHVAWNLAKNINMPLEPVQLAPFNQPDGLDVSLNEWLPEVALNWLKVGANLRKKWNEFDNRQTPLTYHEVRRVWLRRVAYLLFVDRHGLFPWTLTALCMSDLALLMRFSPGSCTDVTYDDSFSKKLTKRLWYQNAGVHVDDMSGNTRLSLMFYKYVPNWATAVNYSQQSEYPKAADQVDLPRKNADVFVADDKQAKRRKTAKLPTSAFDVHDGELYYSAGVWDTNPAYYFEFIGNLLAVFPKSLANDAKDALGWAIEYLRMRGAQHNEDKPLDPLKDIDLDKAGAWADFLDPSKDQFDRQFVRPWAEGTPDEVNWDRAFSFRYAWVRIIGGCIFTGPLHVSIARALALPAILVKGGHTSAYFPSIGVGMAHADDVIDGSVPGLSLNSSGFFASDSWVSYESIIAWQFSDWSPKEDIASAVREFFVGRRLVAALERGVEFCLDMEKNPLLSQETHDFYKFRRFRMLMNFRDDDLAAEGVPDMLTGLNRAASDFVANMYGQYTANRNVYIDQLFELVLGDNYKTMAELGSKYDKSKAKWSVPDYVKINGQLEVVCAKLREPIKNGKAATFARNYGVLAGLFVHAFCQFSKEGSVPANTVYIKVAYSSIAFLLRDFGAMKEELAATVMGAAMARPEYNDVSLQIWSWFWLADAVKHLRSSHSWNARLDDKMYKLWYYGSPIALGNPWQPPHFPPMEKL